MDLTDETVDVVVANDGQEIIMVDDLSQLNEKSVEGLYRVLQSPGGNTGDVSNPGVEVSAVPEVNLQGIIYYIKIINRIGHTCTHADVDLAKVRAMYFQRDIEEAHKDP